MVTNAEVIEELRKSGYKVRIHHRRKYEAKIKVIDIDVKGRQSYEVTERILPRGGETVVELTTPDGEVLVGDSVCCEKDFFNKKMGVKIALGRALKCQK